MAAARTAFTILDVSRRTLAVRTELWNRYAGPETLRCCNPGIPHAPTDCAAPSNLIGGGNDGRPCRGKFAPMRRRRATLPWVGGCRDRPAIRLADPTAILVLVRFGYVVRKPDTATDDERQRPEGEQVHEHSVW